jgi:hypothetical protein
MSTLAAQGSIPLRSLASTYRGPDHLKNRQVNSRYMVINSLMELSGRIINKQCRL